MAAPTCQTCPFFERLSTVPPSDGWPAAGQCRRRAPVPKQEPDEEGDHLRLWPIVWEDDWCGEHPGRVVP